MLRRASRDRHGRHDGAGAPVDPGPAPGLSTADDPILLGKGRYVARLARSRAELEAARALRIRCFGTHAAGADAHDAACEHVLVCESGGADPVACFRMLTLENGRQLHRSCSAQFYDLSALSRFPGPMAEIGRFCIAPGRLDADILRLAWGAMTVQVDRAGIEMLFGCSSFAGTSAAAYADAFAWLRQRHLAPCRWRPREKAPETVRFAEGPAHAPDARAAMLRMPPLLRTYLAMGGWVSDHAVIDRQMNTLHVFTGLDIRAIPPARKRLLRAVAG